MRILNNSVKATVGWLAVSAALHAAPVYAMQSSMALPATWNSVLVKTVSMSPNHAHVCIAGSNNTLTEKPAGFLMLVDYSHQTIAWQTKISPPSHLASFDPVQCLIEDDHVYLLAHATVSLTRQAQELTYVAQFDMRGKQLAGKLVDLEAENIFAYGMTRSAGLLKVMGYTKDVSSEAEKYATYTVSFDDQLRQNKSPLIRKNGAFVYPATARIVADDMYIGGRFFKDTVSNRDVGDFSASKLRVGGGYRWSQHTLPGDPRGLAVGISGDGSVFTIARDQQKTLLSVIRPDSKVIDPIDYVSLYCDTQQLTGYADGALAIREPCRGGPVELVFINGRSGAERPIHSILGVPLIIATQDDLMITISRDQTGMKHLQTTTSGDQQ